MTKTQNLITIITKPLLFILITIFLNYLAIGKSLQFALNGDDWLALWRFHTTFPNLNSLFNLNNYYTNYDIANIMMGMIYYLSSYNPFPYYFISLLFRIFAIISLYFAVYSSTKSKIAAGLSGLFLSSMFAGIETTNWVFNLNTYLSLGLVNVSIYFYFKNENYKPLVKILLVGVLFAVSFAVAPTRMHGLLFLLPILLIMNKPKNYPFLKLLRNLSLIIIPLLAVQNLFSAGSITLYLNSFLPSLKNPSLIAGSLLANLGHILLPNRIIVFNHITPTLSYILLGLGYLIFTLITSFKFRKNSPKLAKASFLFLLLSMFFLIIPVMINYPASFSSEHRYLLIPGAYLLSSVAVNLLLLWQIKLSRGIIILVILFISLINLSTLSWYFDLMSKEGRLQDDRQKQFSTIQSLIKEVPRNSPLVFLILADDPFYAYNTIQFGFSYQMILTDSRFSWDKNKEPLVVDNLNSLIDVLSDPNSKELKRYGYTPVDIPVENAYVFTLQNKSLHDSTSSYKPLIFEKISTKKSQKKNN